MEPPLLSAAQLGKKGLRKHILICFLFPQNIEIVSEPELQEKFKNIREADKSTVQMRRERAAVAQR